MSDITDLYQPLTPEEAQAAFAALPKEQQNGTLAPSTYRNLIDRMYEKRKLGAVEIEKNVRILNAVGQDAAVRKIIDTLKNEFINTTQGNYKKGGLIALAAVAVAFGPTGISKYLILLASPVLACMKDPDTRVRYYALESFYNIAKVAREGVLGMFNNVFDCCCQLSADPDLAVRSASQLLDMLMKDIVTQQPNGSFDLERFVPTLRRRSAVEHPNARHFLNSWLIVLNSVPDINIIKYIPEFLDGILSFLVDEKIDVQQETAGLLKEFLKELVSQEVTDINMPALVKILINRCKQVSDALKPEMRALANSSKDSSDSAKDSSPAKQAQLSQAAASTTANSTTTTTTTTTTTSGATDGNVKPAASPQPAANAAAATSQQEKPKQPTWTSAPASISIKAMEPITLTVLEWLSTLIEYATKPDIPCQNDFLVQGPLIFTVLLPLISKDESQIGKDAMKVNASLLKFFASLPNDKVNPFVKEYLDVVLVAVNVDNTKHCRLVGIEWLTMFHDKFGEGLLPYSDLIFPPLLKSLSDKSDDILLAASKISCALSASEAFFEREVTSLVTLFLTEPRYMRERSAKIVRLLCRFIDDAEKIFIHISRTIVSLNADTEASAETVQILNILLLTMDEARVVRHKLGHHMNCELFETLHRAWAFSPSSLFSLCLLSQSYKHAAAITDRFCEMDVTVPFLLELDQIVQLFESPAFVRQRTQLLSPNQFPDLVRAMYGLLMVLPQSQAYSMLKKRLSAAAKFAQFQALQAASGEPPKIEEPEGYEPHYDKLLDEFVELQKLRASHAIKKQKKIDTSLV